MKKVLDPEDDLKLSEELNEFYAETCELIHSYRRRERSATTAPGTVLMMSAKQSHYTKFGLKIEKRYDFSKTVPRDWDALSPKCWMIEVAIRDKQTNRSVVAEKWCFTFEMEGNRQNPEDAGFFTLTDPDDRRKKFCVLMRSLSSLLVNLPIHKTFIKFWLAAGRRPDHIDRFDLEIHTYHAPSPTLLNKQQHWDPNSIKWLETVRMNAISLNSHNFTFFLTFLTDFSFLLKAEPALNPQSNLLPVTGQLQPVVIPIAPLGPSPESSKQNLEKNSVKGVGERFKQSRPRILSEDYTKITPKNPIASPHVHAGRIGEGSGTFNAANSPFCITPRQPIQESISPSIDHINNFSPPFETHM